jgi:hypothetical protein
MAIRTVDEHVQYLLDKVSYLLKKVENYDRALNEFAQIKLTIDEAAENTRSSKNIVRETKDSVNTNSIDICTLSKAVHNLSHLFHNDREHLRNMIGDLDIRSFDEDERLESLINTLELDIQEDLKSYLTTNDLRDINRSANENTKFLQLCISNAHENNLALDLKVSSLEERLDLHEEKIMSLRKDMCRFQNAMLRKGVSIDD